jgi:hypothetical protein
MYILLQKPPVRGAANPPLNSMPAVMSPTQEYPVTPQVAPAYGRNPGDVSADLLVNTLFFTNLFVQFVLICIII